MRRTEHSLAAGDRLRAEARVSSGMLHFWPLQRKACSALAAVILFWAICAFSADPQSDRSCRGSSGPPHAAQTASQTGKTESRRPHGIKLTWEASTSPAKQVKGYYIFRRESGPSCQSEKNKCERLNPTMLMQGTSCTDYEVQPSHTYIYQVQTVSISTSLSKFSNEAKATAR
jgi:hypothetical protein